MTLWIGNGTVLKSSSQCQSNEFRKLNNLVIIMVIIMTLWIGNGTVLKSSSQCQSNEFRTLNNFVHELCFQNSFNCN